MSPITRDFILGTAGHIDHGKTALVKALTGTDCDRLPEEKARGITIDIGFAQLELGEFRLGIVDVPGHERFVKNMLAGATGIDLALLIVAADDSVMPQTREHLEILGYLGIRRGVVALTKTDLVDETTREVVALEVRELIRGTVLSDAAIIPTSAVTGAGLEELKAALQAACREVPPIEDPGNFRLPIDRAFVVQGYGAVATGSVVSGTVTVGDELDWHNGDGKIERVRVRGLNNHGKSVASSCRGQRAAINLAGISHDRVQRGQELATAGTLVPSRLLTVRLGASAATRRSLKHRLPVRLHIGTAEVMATISLLDCDRIQAGSWGLAQMFLAEPITAVWGQPFVIRDSSAEHTLGGGQVLQPEGVKIRRRSLELLEHVEQLTSPDERIRSAAAAWFAGFKGFHAHELCCTAGISPLMTSTMVNALVTAGTLVELALQPQRQLLLHTERVVELENRVLGSLARLHAENPLATSHDRGKLLGQLDYIGDEALLQAIVERLLQARKLVGDSRRLARADFKPKLSVNQRKLKDKIVEAHAAAGLQPPEPKDFANQAAGHANALKEIYAVAVAEGFLVKIAAEMYLHHEAERAMRSVVTQRLQGDTGATISELRDLLGITRKYAIPLCEYLDRIGLTQRDGDLRFLAQPGDR